ncbi:MAG: c-type cytochrome [Gammaproteobacteria bacterium]
MKKYPFLLTAMLILVGPPAVAVDLENGEEINQVCAACHGEFGQGGKGGEYPRLAGLPAEYIADQLRKFKGRHRINLPMLPYATDREVPEDQIMDIATYLSSIQLMNKFPEQDAPTDAFARLMLARKVLNIPRWEGDIEAGRKLYKWDCAGCHGRDGLGKPKWNAPPLTGQYSEYLERQIQKFRTGEREHEDAELYFSELSEKDIQDMLAYLSILDD